MADPQTLFKSSGKKSGRSGSAYGVFSKNNKRDFLEIFVGVINGGGAKWAGEGRRQLIEEVMKAEEAEEVSA